MNKVVDIEILRATFCWNITKIIWSFWDLVGTSPFFSIQLTSNPSMHWIWFKVSSLDPERTDLSFSEDTP